MSLPTWLTSNASGVSLNLKVQPRASSNGIGPCIGDQLKIKVRGLDIEPRLGSDLHWQWASELQQICPGPGRALLGLELCWVD